MRHFLHFTALEYTNVTPGYTSRPKDHRAWNEALKTKKTVWPQGLIYFFLHSPSEYWTKLFIVFIASVFSLLSFISCWGFLAQNIFEALEWNLLNLWDQAVIFTLNTLFCLACFRWRFDCRSKRGCVRVKNEVTAVLPGNIYFWCKTVTTFQEHIFIKSPHCDF